MPLNVGTRRYPGGMDNSEDQISWLQLMFVFLAAAVGLPFLITAVLWIAILFA